MSDLFAGKPQLIVEVTITELVDGQLINKMTVHRAGAGDYLATAERVLRAVAGEPESEETT